MSDLLKKVDLDRLRQRLASEDVHVIAADLGVPTVTLAAFCREHQLPWPGAKAGRPVTAKPSLKPGAPKVEAPVTPRQNLYRAPKEPPVIPTAKQGEGWVSITREQLYDLMWSCSTVQLAKAWQRSDVSISKLCKAYKIPKPTLGDWAKMRAGHAVQRPPLPEPDTAKENLRISIAPSGLISPDEERLDKARGELIRQYPVPDFLNSPHPLIERTLKALEKAKPGDRGLLHPKAKGVLPMVVGPDSVGRAMRFLNAFIHACEIEGMKVEVTTHEHVHEAPRFDTMKRRLIPAVVSYTSTARVLVLGELFSFDLEERASRQLKPMSDEDAAAVKEFGRYRAELYDLVPNGVFHFHFGTQGYPRRFSFSDTKRHHLEDRLGEIVAEFKVRAQEEQRRREEEAARQKRAEEERRQREEAERLRVRDEQRKKRFYRQVKAWRYMRDAMEYVRFVRDRAAKLEGGIPPETQAWLEWAERHVEELDPLRDGLPNHDRYGTGIPQEDEEHRRASNPYGYVSAAADLPKPYPFWLKFR